MKITILDALTLGTDITFDCFEQFGKVEVFGMSSPEQIEQRIEYSDVIVLNKIKLNKSNLHGCKNLKLICVAATGYDNIDVEYCKNNGIAVCNVVGYSTHCVSQVTVSMVLSLINHLPEYDKCVKDLSYTNGGVQNKLTPVYHELYGKTWGVIGAGNIGGQVANVAKAFGCKVIVYKRNKTDDYTCVELDELMGTSDIITIHLPLSEHTKNIINSDMIALMKKDAVIVNAARGAVWDENAVAQAILNKKIAGMGSDVYSVEPMSKDHPFADILNFDNVCLTPHMAWGSYESRVRCINEIANNIKMYFEGKIHNRVDIQEEML